MSNIEITKKALTAYKAVTKRSDGKYECLEQIYEAGETYTIDGDIQLCRNGFHCCPNAIDVYNYYMFGDNTDVFKITIPKGSQIIKDGDKWCVSSIKFPEKTVANNSFNQGIDNTGYGNTGDRNTGDRNTGYGNTGYGNTGYGNTGDRNTGYGNTGDWNTGNRNTGNRNTGYGNTGYGNTGDRNTGYGNTGDWNSTNYQTGFFNTIEQPVSLFNGSVTMPRSEVINHPAYKALLSVPLKLTRWVDNADLPLNERTGEHTNGKQVPVGWLEAHREWWANMSDENKKLVQTLPGFCPDIFKEITGIDVSLGG